MAKAKDILKVEPEPAKAVAVEAPPAAKEIGDHSAFLAERLDRSMKRFAAIKAKEKEMAEAMAERLAKAKAAAPNDHVAPRIGAKDVLAMHESTSKITSARKLEALAKKHPEVAALLAASKQVIPVKTEQPAKPVTIPVKVAEVIPVKTQDEPNPLLTEK